MFRRLSLAFNQSTPKHRVRKPCNLYRKLITNLCWGKKRSILFKIYKQTTPPPKKNKKNKKIKSVSTFPSSSLLLSLLAVTNVMPGSRPRPDSQPHTPILLDSSRPRTDYKHLIDFIKFGYKFGSQTAIKGNYCHLSSMVLACIKCLLTRQLREESPKKM